LVGSAALFGKIGTLRSFAHPCRMASGGQASDTAMELRFDYG